MQKIGSMTNFSGGMTTTLYKIGADVCHTEVAVSVKNRFYFFLFSLSSAVSFNRVQVSFLFQSLKSLHVRKIVDGPRDTKYEHASE